MLKAPDNALAYCSSALVRLGCEPIESFDDGSVEAVVAKQEYPMARDSLLCETPWSFARVQARLARLDTSDTGEFSGAFATPSDMIMVISVKYEHGIHAVSYRLQDGKILCNETPVLDYIRRPAEAEFPPFFKEVLISKLALQFCLPLTENSQRAGLMAQFYETALQKAKSRDSQQNPPKKIKSSPFAAVRW